MWSLLLLACTDAKEDTALPAPEPRLISSQIRLLNVINSAPLDEVEVTSGWEETVALTDESGTAELPVLSNDTYRLSASIGDLEHIYQGVAGEEDFLIVGFLVDRSTTVQVFQLLESSNPEIDLEHDSSTGVVVVAMDTPSLAPAIGAQAELVVDGSAFDKSFIFGPAYPELGDTIISGGGSFVFFPNVPAGTAEITATGANGTSCRSAPGGSTNGRFTVDVEADTVSVAVFVCE